MTDQDRLGRLIAARHACIFMPTHEEDYALSVVREAAFAQGLNLWLWSVIGGVRDGLTQESQPVPETEHPAAGLYHLTQIQDRCVAVVLDLVGHLRDDRTLRVLRDLVHQYGQTGSVLVIIDHRGDLPDVLRSDATSFELSLPTEKELEMVVRDTLRSLNRRKTIEVDITRSGLRTIIRNLRGLTRRQAAQIIVDCVWEDCRFDLSDLNTVLARKRQALQTGGLLEYVEAPVDLDEIGGLDRLKAWLRRRQFALTEDGARFGLEAPRGVLMLGVQGAGKSLCAKAIATAWQQPLLRMDVGALYDRYVGESERRLREALSQAGMMAPVVLWIDEIEKAFASAAARSTDGGLSQRMFGSLLTWMQEHREAVFLVATANDIEALPPELLRKGRFDEIFFVDLPEPEVRRDIFRIHLAKRGQDAGQFDLDALSVAAEGFSGAEIEQAVIAGLHEAFAEKHALTTSLLLHTLAESPPLSVTMAEQMAALRAWAQKRCMPAH